jgi:hypothetical protein
MNAIELFHQDGKSAKVFYCSGCRVVAKTQEEAERCCQPVKCNLCGREVGETYWTRCEACRNKAEADAERQRFEKAEKVTSYDGPFFSESISGYQDGFFTNISELFDYCADEEIAVPEYVWASHPFPIVDADVDSIISHIGESLEDFDSKTLNGLDDLKNAITAFNEANRDLVSYEPDYSKAVLIQAPANPSETPNS